MFTPGLILTLLNYSRWLYCVDCPGDIQNGHNQNWHKRKRRQTKTATVFLPQTGFIICPICYMLYQSINLFVIKGH